MKHRLDLLMTKTCWLWTFYLRNLFVLPTGASGWCTNKTSLSKFTAYASKCCTNEIRLRLLHVPANVSPTRLFWLCPLHATVDGSTTGHVYVHYIHVPVDDSPTKLVFYKSSPSTTGSSRRWTTWIRQLHAPADRVPTKHDCVHSPVLRLFQNNNGAHSHINFLTILF